MDTIGVVSGAIAGTSAALLTHPLDVLRLRRQLEGSSKARLLSLYKGMSAAMIRESVYCGAKFTIYGEIKHTNKVAAGAFAGAMATLVSHPLDLVKVVKVCTPLEASNLRILVNIFRSGCAFKGVLPAVQRSIVFSSAQLSSFDQGKIWLLTLDPDLERHVVVCTSAWLAGLISTFVSNPIDVVKTRSMVGSNIKIFECARSVIAREGVRALWRGSFFTWLRLGPYTFVQMLVWESCADSWRA